MRLRGVLIGLIVVACCAAPHVACAAGSTVETRVLLDGRNANGWSAAEATLSPAAAGGEDAMLFRVPVDWHGGEPAYPIGWPRIQRDVPAEQGDWRGWDQLRVRILPRTSADRFPFRPFGVTITSGDRGGWERDVQAIRANEWQEVTFDLRDLPSPGRVHGQGLFISEDKYADGTVLEFYLSRIELVRYTAPTLVGFRPLAEVAFADAGSLPVQVKLYGVPAGRTAPVALKLAQGKKLLASAVAPASAGEAQLALPLVRPLSPGDYTLSGTVSGHTLSASVRLVASPWQEVH